MKGLILMDCRSTRVFRPKNPIENLFYIRHLNRVNSLKAGEK